MTDTRTVTFDSEAERAHYFDELEREGYTRIQSDPPVFESYDRGSLLAHLALFFTVGFWTLGLANLVYAMYRKRKTHDRVRVAVQSPPVESTPGP